MRIVTLLENGACREDLKQEHGLSLYIETGNCRILFDAGQTAAFADNAKALGVDLREVDFAVLSHGHYDHGGGLARFLELNPTAPVYVSSQAFCPHYNGTEKYIGLDNGLLDTGRLILTHEDLQLAEGITLHTCRDAEWSADSYGLNVLRDGRLEPDDFCHEQYLLIREGEKRTCFSGCSHRGVVNIARHFAPDVLVGGFHFVKLDPQGPGAAPLEEAAEALLALPTVYYTGHCTGQAQFEFLKARMEDRLQSLSGGIEVIL